MKAILAVWVLAGVLIHHLLIVYMIDISVSVMEVIHYDLTFLWSRKAVLALTIVLAAVGVALSLLFGSRRGARSWVD